MAQTEVAKAIVDVDGRQAGAELKKLEDNAKSLRNELAKLGRDNDLAGFRQKEKELKLVQNQMRNLKKETYDVEKTLKRLNGSSFNELAKAQRILKSEIKNMNRESKEEIRLYNEKVAKLKLVEKELGKVKAEMYGVDRAQRSWFGSVTGGYQKVVGLIAGVTAAATGVAYSFKKSIDAANEFEDSLSNLSALTGLQGTDLEWLSESAKQFSVETTKSGVRIRQSAKEILDAYTVMGSQRPELLRDKEALAAVTEQAIILSEAGKIKLEPAVAALANTLNQFNLSGEEASRVVNVIAAGSKVGAADIDYVSTAIEKAGTTANLMGISVEEAVGAIETIGPKFSEATTAGNSLDKVLLKMSDKQIGYKDGVFDLSRALDELSVMFDGGVSAASIFGVEHAKMAEVLVQGRDEFKRYTAEVTGTNIAIEQASINTDTNSAKLAQAKNKLNLVAIELGDRVAPAFTSANNILAGLMSGLVNLFNVFDEYKAYIISGTVALAAYSLVVNAVTIGEKLYTVATKVAEAATKAFNTTLKASPWGILAAVITGAVTALVVFGREMKTVTAEMRVQKRMSDALDESLSRETASMNQMFENVKRLNISSTERKDLIKQINDQYGQYLPNLLTEKSSIQEIEAAQKSANIALEESIRKKVRNQVLVDVLTEKTKKQLELERLHREQVAKTGFDYGTDERFDTVEMSKVRRELNDLQQEYVFLNNMINSTIEPLPQNKIDTIQRQIDNLEQSLSGITDKSSDAYKQIDKLINDKKKELEKLKKDDDDDDDDDTKVPLPPVEEDKELADRIRREQEYRQSILNRDRSLIEQENLAYQQRLTDAGIFQKKKEEMTEEDLLILEKLETEHINNIKKINSDSAEFDLRKEQEEFDKITLLRQIAHNNELAAVANNEEARAELQKKYEEEELERKRIYLEKLIEQLQGALAGEDTFPGIDETLLSDEQLADFQSRIEQLKLDLSELNLKKAELASSGTEEKPAFGSNLTLKTDIFGMSTEDWVSTIENIKEGNLTLEDTINIIGSLTEAYSMYSQIRKNQEDKALMEYESNIERRKELLQSQLDRGVISQDQYNQRVSALDQELDKRKQAIAMRQAQREKATALMGAIVNTALAIVNALTTKPAWLGLVLAAMVGTMGGMQIATIASQPMPQFASGYYDAIGGQDGKKYRGPVIDSPGTGLISSPSILVGEKPEIIIDPYTTRNLMINYPGVIDAINHARMPQYASGKYPASTEKITERPLPVEFYETISELRSVMQTISRNGIQAKLLADDEYIRAHNKVSEEYQDLRNQTSLRS